MAETLGKRRYMSVREVAEYLHLNEKKIYLLASEGKIPGTKITGKWIFPRELVDQWVLTSSHGGLLNDKLLIAGTQDFWLEKLSADLARRIGANGVVSYSSNSVNLGLKLLQRDRIDVCCIRWGPDSEADIRHPALLQRYDNHRDWILVRALRRQQGLMLSTPQLNKHSLEEMMALDLNWAHYSKNSAGRRIFEEQFERGSQLPHFEKSRYTVNSEQEAASLLARKLVDVAPGSKSTASEYGLSFQPLAWENIDFVMRRKTYFRTLCQKLIESLTDVAHSVEDTTSKGYDVSESGKIIWCHDQI